MIQALGKFTVAVAGTPVRATSTQTNPAEKLGIHGFLIQALSTNGGKVYVGTTGMNKTTLAGVLAVIAVPTTNSGVINQIPTFSAALTLAPNAINLADIWIDVDTGGEGALISILIM